MVWRMAALAGCTAALLLLSGNPLSAQPPGFPPDCDEYDPFGPARSTRIMLDSTDFVDSHGDEMRSFIETGSIGHVEVSYVGAPPGSILAMSVIPETSRMSRYYGEELKGIAIGFAFNPGRHPSRVVLSLRQVCAEHFYNTFLYY